MAGSGSILKICTMRLCSF